MKHSLFKDSVVFASSRYVLLGLSLIRNFFVAKFLGPSDYGLWVVIGLLLTYGDQIHLGLRHAGDKEIPYYRGQGRGDESLRIANTIFGGVLSLSTLAFLFLVIYVLFLRGSDDSLLRYGILVSAFIIVTDQINRFYLMILRTRHEFFLSSKVEAGFEFLRTVAVSALVVAFHFLGAIVGLFVASFAAALYFVLRHKREFSPNFSLHSMRPLLAMGLPLSATGLLYILLLNLDRVVGAIAFSKEDLGIYGMASLMAQIPVTSSQGISSVVYPRISERFGEGHDPAQLKPLFGPAITGAAFIAPVLVASIFFVGRFLILWLLPAYSNSINLLFLLSFGICFLCLAPIPAAFLMAAGRNLLYLRSEVFTVIIIVGVYGLLFLTRPLTLPVLAVVTSASFFLLSALLLGHAHSILGMTGTVRLKEVTKLYLPSLYTGTALAFINNLFPLDQHLRIEEYLWQLVASLALYYLVYLPMVYLLDRSTGSVSRLLRSLAAKGGKVL